MTRATSSRSRAKRDAKPYVGAVDGSLQRLVMSTAGFATPAPHSSAPQLSVSPEKRPHVLQQHEQLERVCGRLLEVELHVPTLRGLVLGVHKEHARSDRLRCLGAPEEDVLQERPAEACALVALVDGEAREQDRGDWPGTRLALRRPRRCVSR